MENIHVFVFLLFVSLSSCSLIIFNNQTAHCTEPTAPCSFNDTSIWVDNIAPSDNDTVVVMSTTSSLYFNITSDISLDNLFFYASGGEVVISGAFVEILADSIGGESTQIIGANVTIKDDGGLKANSIILYTYETSLTVLQVLDTSSLWAYELTAYQAFFSDLAILYFAFPWIYGELRITGDASVTALPSALLQGPPVNFDNNLMAHNMYVADNASLGSFHWLHLYGSGSYASTLSLNHWVVTLEEDAKYTFFTHLTAEQIDLNGGSSLTVEGSCTALYLGPVGHEDEYGHLQLVNGVSSFGNAGDSFIRNVNIAAVNSELYITGLNSSHYLLVNSTIHLTNSTFYGNSIGLIGAVNGDGTLIADNVSIQNSVSLEQLIVADTSVLRVQSPFSSPAVFTTCQIGAGSLYINGLLLCNSSNMNVNLNHLQLTSGMLHLTYGSTLFAPETIVSNSSYIVASQFATHSVVIEDINSYLSVHGRLILENATIQIPLYPPGDFNQSVFTVDGDVFVQGAKIIWPQFNETSVHPRGKVSLVRAVSGSIIGDVELTFPNITGLRVPHVYYNHNASEIVLDFSDYPEPDDNKHLPVWAWVLIAVGGFAVAAVAAFFVIRHIRRRAGYEEVAK